MHAQQTLQLYLSDTFLYIYLLLLSNFKLFALLLLLLLSLLLLKLHSVYMIGMSRHTRTHAHSHTQTQHQYGGDCSTASVFTFHFFVKLRILRLLFYHFRILLHIQYTNYVYALLLLPMICVYTMGYTLYISIPIHMQVLCMYISLCIQRFRALVCGHDFLPFDAALFALPLCGRLAAARKNFLDFPPKCRICAPATHFNALAALLS